MKCKLIALSFSIVCWTAVCFYAATSTAQNKAADQTSEKRAATPRNEAATKTVQIKGQILDEDERPLENAEVNAVFLSHQPKDSILAGGTLTEVTARTQTDSKGMFHLTVRAPDNVKDIALELFAYKKGYAVTFGYLENEKERENVKLKLPKEKPFVLKLLAPDGKPLPEVSVKLHSVRSTNKAIGMETFPFTIPPESFPAWPTQNRTGPDGLVTVNGLGPNYEIMFAVSDPRVALQNGIVDTDKTPSPHVVRTSTLRMVEGKVLRRDKQTPIANADIEIISSDDGNDYVGRVLAKTNEHGAFSAKPYMSKMLRIEVMTKEKGYQSIRRTIPWIEGTKVQKMFLPLPEVGYEPMDGTTRDGKLANPPVEKNYPDAPIEFKKPTNKLTEKLSGTIFGTAILFDSKKDRVGGNQKIIAISPETGDFNEITANATLISISPDSKNIIYQNVNSNSLFTVPTDFSAQPKNHRLSHGGACWISSDQFIANVNAEVKRDYYGEEYWAQESEKSIFRMSGEKLSTIPLPPLYDVYDVSKDAKWIAMQWDTHSHMNGARIFLSKIDGSELKPIAQKREEYYWHPRFSPDGKSVLAKHLNAHDGGTLSLRILALDGSREVAISLKNLGEVESACWSPDGKHIAIKAYLEISDDSGPARLRHLVITNADATEVKKIELKNTADYSLNGELTWTDATFKSK